MDTQESPNSVVRANPINRQNKLSEKFEFVDSV